MAVIYFTADGAGRGMGEVPAFIYRWMRAHGNPSLIVNGGDVYKHGRDKDFARFLEQIDGNTADMCETAGNHDWQTTSRAPDTGIIPSEYEAFWTQFAPPRSRQPIDRTKRGGARYDHFIDMDGWRLVFVDTGPCNDERWPVGDPDRVTWLRRTLTATPGRAKIVFAHHSRLSRGKHGDIRNVDELWKAMFASDGTPLAALSMSGHDHNVSVYSPRGRDNPEEVSRDAAPGIWVVVNGAGGHGHDMGFRGTRPDHFDSDNFCATRITLIDERSADVETLSFGHNDPPRVAQPSVAHRFEIRL